MRAEDACQGGRTLDQSSLSRPSSPALSTASWRLTTPRRFLAASMWWWTVRGDSRRIAPISQSVLPRLAHVQALGLALGDDPVAGIVLPHLPMLEHDRAEHRGQAVDDGPRGRVGVGGLGRHADQHFLAGRTEDAHDIAVVHAHVRGLAPHGLGAPVPQRLGVGPGERAGRLQKQLHARIVDDVAFAPVALVPAVEVSAAQRRRLLAVVLGIDQGGAEPVVAEGADRLGEMGFHLMGRPQVRRLAEKRPGLLFRRIQHARGSVLTLEARLGLDTPRRQARAIQGSAGNRFPIVAGKGGVAL